MGSMKVIVGKIAGLAKKIYERFGIIRALEMLGIYCYDRDVGPEST